MQAWQLDQLSDIKSAHLAEVPDPIPGPGEALLTLHYAALNPADAYLAKGEYPARPPLPHILGRDGMGIITALGPPKISQTDSKVTTSNAPTSTSHPKISPKKPPISPTFAPVSRLKPNEKALIMRSEIGVNLPGTFAQKVCVPLENLAPIPPGWSDQEAASASLVYLTAYQALTQWENPFDPQVVLITGASGGVGVASIQLAKALGHTVLALSRSPGKSTAVLALGAHAVYHPDDKTWPKKLRAFLNPDDPETKTGKRVHLAIDNIGGHQLPDVIDTLAMNGRVSLVGRLAGPVPNFNTAALFFRRLRLGGVAVGTYTLEESTAAWQHILELLNKINARPVIDKVFAFDDIYSAFDRLAAGPMGKVLLQIIPNP